MSKIGWLVIGGALLIGVLLFFKYAQPSTPATGQKPPALKAPDIEKLNLQNWHEFSEPSQNFKVLFPTLPQHATEKTEDPKTNTTRQYEMFVSEKDNGSIFMISLITLLEEAKKDPDEKLLKNVLNEMLTASPSSTIKTMQLGQYQNYPALDFTIVNDQINVDGKVFIVDKTLYIISSVSKLPNYNREEYDFFVNSFQLTSSSAKPETPIKAK